MYLRCIYTPTADSRTPRRFAATALICLLGIAGLADDLHEVETRHVRCEVHGGWRHDDAPADASTDLHTDDHGDLKFLQHATAPSFSVLPTSIHASEWRLTAPTVRLTIQKKVWALAPKGSPPHV